MMAVLVVGKLATRCSLLLSLRLTPDPLYRVRLELGAGLLALQKRASGEPVSGTKGAVKGRRPKLELGWPLASPIRPPSVAGPGT